ncbi:hypothetical protein D3C79_833530 [compost metagenome]
MLLNHSECTASQGTVRKHQITLDQLPQVFPAFLSSLSQGFKKLGYARRHARHVELLAAPRLDFVTQEVEVFRTQGLHEHGLVFADPRLQFTERERIGFAADGDAALFKPFHELPILPRSESVLLTYSQDNLRHLLCH